MVPISIVRLKSLFDGDGDTPKPKPALLYGYGSYGICIDPGFDRRILPYVELLFRRYWPMSGIHNSPLPFPPLLSSQSPSTYGMATVSPPKPLAVHIAQNALHHRLCAMRLMMSR